VVALRNLKNEVVGHEQRKELAVTYGVVGLLAGLLGEGVRRGGKRHGNGAREGSNGAAASSRPPASLSRPPTSLSRPAAPSRIRQVQTQEDWTKEDELRFQATLVVGSLANGEHVIQPHKNCWGHEG
jgi:hypothetical protein